MSTIGLKYALNLAAGDSVALTGLFVADCVPSPTSTPTATPTASATASATQTSSATATSSSTPTPVPVGGDCTDPAQCASGLFCTDGVCCTSLCDDPLRRCNVPPNVGICTDVTAPAPTLSPAGVWMGIAALLATGVVAMRRRRRG
ncbi:MAG: hypothetical protein ACRERC_00545 [Candidatus Binatia bacterium]